MAAESYGRLSNKPALVNVTTGPGGINAINGVFGAWTDSIPMLVISGQVRYNTTIEFSKLPIRQLGDQEVDIINMVKGITKYSKMITKVEDVKDEIIKAYNIAISGRMGPVWLDIPMDIQGSFVTDKVEKEIERKPNIINHDQEDLKSIIEKIKVSKRPAIIAGNGIRFSKSTEILRQITDKLKIPILTAWNAHDIIEDDFEYYYGRPGTVGDRPGNLIIQNCDFLLILGSRLNIRQIGYNWESFSRDSFKVMVDIDENELKKHTLSIDYPINSDLKVFLKSLDKELSNNKISKKEDWIRYCSDVRKKYPILLEEHLKSEKVNPYYFFNQLSEILPENEIITLADGTACVVGNQAFKIKKGQRLYHNSGCASMGYGLPAAIGAWKFSHKRVICVTGDGSISQNIQELSVVSSVKMNIIIFILNNDGYHSIRQTQQNFFGRFIGCGPDSNLYFPDYKKVAQSHGLKYFSVKKNEELNDVLKDTLKETGPLVCEVFLDKNQEFAPKVSSFKDSSGNIFSRPLEDQSPFLDRDELRSLMFIDLIKESEE
jgi:acetolactate synthase-1/2/3 large subunit